MDKNTENVPQFWSELDIWATAYTRLWVRGLFAFCNSWDYDENYFPLEIYLSFKKIGRI